MIFLRQSTASQEVLLGPFLDDTTGKDAETGLTVANTDIKIWKNGATTEANKNSGGATHIAAGRYYCVLDATDTDTIGPLEINVHVAGALPVRRACVVLHANVFDVLFGSVAPSTHTAAAVQALVAAGAVASVTGAVGSVTGNVGGNVTGSVGSVASGGITAASFAANAITAAKLDPDVTTELQSGLATASALSTVAGYLDTEIAAILAAVDTEVAAIKAKTDNLPASPAATGDIPSAATIADAVWDEAQSGHTTAGTFGLYLDAAVSGVSTGGVNAADIADAVWDEALSGHATAGSAGKAVADILDDTGTSGVAVSPTSVRSAVGLAAANLDAQLAEVATWALAAHDRIGEPTGASLSDDVAAVKADTAAILIDTGTDGVVVASGSKTGYSLATAPPTATENADALLGRNIAGGSSAGRTVSQALYALRNRVTRSGATLTVYATDDSTVAWTAAITTDAAAELLTGVDPS